MKKLSLLQKQTVLFGEKEVRRTWHNEQWYFSISDVVQVLTDSNDVKQYIKKCVYVIINSRSTGVQFVPPFK